MWNHNNRNTSLMIALIILFVFQIPLQYIFSPFKIWDEFYGMLFFPLFFFWIVENEYIITVRKSTVLLLVILALFCGVGIVSTFRWHYQPLRVAGLDCFLHLKFYLAIGGSFILAREIDFKDFYSKLWKILQIIIVFIFAVVLLDLVFHIFPSTYRMGLRSESIFYGLPTNLAAVGIFLIALLFRMYEYVENKTTIYLAMMSLVVLCTLRAKAWGGLFFAIFIFVIMLKGQRRPGPISWMMMGFGILGIAWVQISKYYNVDNLKEVRNVLTLAGIRIAKDYFPIGTGFATYGSAYSTDPYSRVYYLYHLNHIWGMSKEYSSFISDTFWPMIMGQTGFLGTLLYIGLIVVLFVKIMQLRSHNIYSYSSALVAFVYLIISSTSESSFVNPMALPLALLIGMALAEKSLEEERRLLR